MNIENAKQYIRGRLSEIAKALDNYKTPGERQRLLDEYEFLSFMATVLAFNFLPENLKPEEVSE